MALCYGGCQEIFMRSFVPIRWSLNDYPHRRPVVLLAVLFYAPSLKTPQILTTGLRSVVLHPKVTEDLLVSLHLFRH